MKILVLHGPNLNLLGTREPHVYGEQSLENINLSIRDWAGKNGVEVEIIQSNHEGELVDAIGSAPAKFDVLVVNPAAFTHTSVALRDAVSAAGIPSVEVHLSNIHSREEFRSKSLIAPVCQGQISGFGGYSYILGLQAALMLVRQG